MLSGVDYRLSQEQYLRWAKGTREWLENLVSELASREKHQMHFKSMVGGTGEQLKQLQTSQCP